MAISKEKLIQYTLRIADNALIIGQRLSEWCGHGPILEQDMAITNIALDQIGEARNLFQFISSIDDKKRNEDEWAMKRHDWEYYNCLLVEQANGDWADTIVRQFIFDSFNFYFHQALAESKEETLAAIGAKSLKEVTYHLRWSSEWMLRIGDGTEESHKRAQRSLDFLWMYSGELLSNDDLENELAKAGIGVDLNKIKDSVSNKQKEIIQKATLTMPEVPNMQRGGKQGRHSEQFGFILSELQYMQRTYPNMQW